MRLHGYYRGKIETSLKCRVRDFDDFALWYTPGVAKPCQEISEDVEKVWDYTNRWNTVAVITDGTRVLGLGNIGPEAALPVMEGKALLYKFLGGVDAFPICLDTSEPEEFREVDHLVLDEQREGPRPVAVAPEREREPGRVERRADRADTRGRWAYHCHLLYHMHAGMFQVVSVRADNDAPVFG